MIFPAPLTLEGHGVRLEPLVPYHAGPLSTAAADGKLWELWFTSVPTADETARYAILKVGVTAIHLHYRGPQVGDDGRLPAGAMITYYLIEVDEYQEMVA